MALFGGRKIIYYPGNTLTKYFPDLVLNWKSLLSDFGIQFDLVEDLNTGWALWDQGYHDEFKEHTAKLKKWFNDQGIKRVITSSPEALFILKTFHKDIQAEHTTQTVHKNLVKVQQFNTAEASWHDNTTQVRRNKIVEQPREILRAAGITIKEFDENRKRTQCLGTSTGLINNSPRLAAKLALRRARKAPIPFIITDSPEDYLHLRRNTTVPVMELSEVLVEI